MISRLFHCSEMHLLALLGLFTDGLEKIFPTLQLVKSLPFHTPDA